MTDATAIPFDEDLAKRVTDEVSAFVLNRNAFAGEERPTPREALFFIDVGGLVPEGYCGELRVKKHARIQIRYRGPTKNFKQGQANMREVWAAVHYAHITGYYEVRAVESEANYLGETRDGNGIWTLNVDMKHDVTLTS